MNCRYFYSKPNYVAFLKECNSPYVTVPLKTGLTIDMSLVKGANQHFLSTLHLRQNFPPQPAPTTTMSHSKSQIARHSCTHHNPNLCPQANATPPGPSSPRTNAPSPNPAGRRPPPASAATPSFPSAAAASASSPPATPSPATAATSSAANARWRTSSRRRRSSSAPRSCARLRSKMPRGRNLHRMRRTRRGL